MPLLFCVFWAVALASDVALCQTNISEQIAAWPQLSKVLAFVLALQVILRGLAEGLTKISDLTENRWDNKLAHILSEASWFLGVILGKMGWGEPSLVTQAKFEKLSEKHGD